MRRGRRKNGIFLIAQYRNRAGNRATISVTSADTEKRAAENDEAIINIGGSS